MRNPGRKTGVRRPSSVLSILRTVVGAETYPFVVTLFIGALAWYVTRYVDRLSVAPIVEYEPAISDSSSNAKNVTITLINLTRATSFRDLRLVLRAYGNQSELSEPSVRVAPPAWEGDAQEPEASGQSAMFALPAFQPGWRILLAARCKRCSDVSLHLASSESPIQLLEPCWQTFFLRHEPAVLGGLLLLWAMLLAFAART